MGGLKYGGGWGGIKIWLVGVYWGNFPRWWRMSKFLAGGGGGTWASPPFRPSRENTAASAKKNSEAIKFLGILKNMCQRFFRLLKKLFVVHTIFKLDFITQIIYCIIEISVFSFHIYFFCSLVSVSKKWNIETMLNLHTISKNSATKWMKEKPGVSEYGPWICIWAN